MRGRVNGLAGAGFCTVTAITFLTAGAVADLASPAVAVTVAAVIGLALVGSAHRSVADGRAAAGGSAGLRGGLTRHAGSRTICPIYQSLDLPRRQNGTATGGTRAPARCSFRVSPSLPYRLEEDRTMLLALRDLRPALPAPVRRTTVRVLATLVAAVLATTLLPTSSASAKSVSFDKRLFGVHDYRLAVADASDDRLDPALGHGHDLGRHRGSPGVYDFARLDQIVRAAMARKVEVTLVLGITPGFYARRPTSTTTPCARRTAPTSARSMERYRNFEGKVAASSTTRSGTR